MKKIVPDPPLDTLVTQETSIGHCPEHIDLFRVQSGVSAEDALVHISLLLNCATTTNNQAIERSEVPAKDFAHCTQHLLEMAAGLVESLLGGLEARTSEPPRI